MLIFTFLTILNCTGRFYTMFKGGLGDKIKGLSVVVPSLTQNISFDENKKEEETPNASSIFNPTKQDICLDYQTHDISMSAIKNSIHHLDHKKSELNKNMTDQLYEKPTLISKNTIPSRQFVREYITYDIGDTIKPVSNTISYPNQNIDTHKDNPINKEKYLQWLHRYMTGVVWRYKDNEYLHLSTKQKLDLYLNENYFNLNMFSFTTKETSTLRRLINFHKKVREILNDENSQFSQDTVVLKEALLNITPKRFNMLINEYFNSHLQGTNEVKIGTGQDIKPDNAAETYLNKIIFTHVKNEMVQKDYFTLNELIKVCVIYIFDNYKEGLNAELEDEDFMFEYEIKYNLILLKLIVHYSRALSKLPNYKEEVQRIETLIDQMKAVIVDFLNYDVEGNETKEIFKMRKCESIDVILTKILDEGESETFE